MTKLCANLTFLFSDLPFLDRFDAAAKAGFRAVECMAPYEAAPEAIRERLDANGLELVLFNFATGRLGRRRPRPGGGPGARGGIPRQPGAGARLCVGDRLQEAAHHAGQDSRRRRSHRLIAAHSSATAVWRRTRL